jgi:t-SNARE complex subunit (syntaxin)
MLESLRGSRAMYERSVQPAEEMAIFYIVELTYQLLKNDLMSVQSELDSLKSEVDTGADDFDNKEREFLQTTIASYYVTLKDKLNEAQKYYSDFKENTKKKVVRQIKNIDTDQRYTDQEINQMAEDDPQALSKMVQRQIMGKASISLQNAAQDVIEKCEGIKKLQKNVKELMEMLKEIAQIVQLQGEKVNTIAEHVTAAKNHVAQANKNLIQAKEHHQAARCVS